MPVGITFSPTLDVGTILQILAFVGSVLYFIYDMRTKIFALNKTIEHFVDRIDKIEKAMEMLSKSAIDIARLEERMNHIDTRAQELSHRINDVGNTVNGSITELTNRFLQTRSLRAKR